MDSRLRGNDERGVEGMTGWLVGEEGMGFRFCGSKSKEREQEKEQEGEGVALREGRVLNTMAFEAPEIPVGRGNA